MAKVLYLTYDGLTDPLGQSQILPYLKGLAGLDHKITIISFEKPRYELLKKSIKYELDNCGITWHPLTYTKNPPIFSTLWDIFKLCREASLLYKKNQFQIVHCRSYITALVGHHLRKKHLIKFIFDMRGFWADERKEGKIWKVSNPFYRWIYHYFKKKEYQFLTESDHIISLTEAGKKVIEGDLTKGKNSPISVIPCCVDLDHFDPNSKKKIIKQDLGFGEEDFILGYLGSIGTWYLLPEMMEFFSVLIHERPTSKFLFITQEDPELILATARKYNISKESIKVLAATRSEVPSFLSILNWSIFFIIPTFSKQGSSPTKQGEIMSMSLPLICNSGIGDTDQIVNNFNSGLIVKEFTMSCYRQVIKQMDSYNLESDNLRNGAREFFGLHNGILKYDRVYRID